MDWGTSRSCGDDGLSAVQRERRPSRRIYEMVETGVLLLGREKYVDWQNTRFRLFYLSYCRSDRGFLQRGRFHGK